MEPFDLRTIAAAYDTVADEYVEAFVEDLQRLPLDRAVLDSFAASVSSRGVALDLGCGPGQVGDYLTDRGLAVVGVDVSLGMLSAGRRRCPSRLAVSADMRRLPFRSGSYRGVVAFYSIQHVRREELDQSLTEIRRVLAVGATMLLATHLGDGEVYIDDFLGRQVTTLGGTLYRQEELVGALERSSFALNDVQLRDPLEHEYPSERIYLTARTRTP